MYIPVPIHWADAYANAFACIRGMERVPTPEFADAGASVDLKYKSLPFL